ncbi:MAG: AbrB/MazE/SpoVT family DNA-binding domain-containing protein [Candidatus Methanoperedens sp.]|nr:AbrB/MazE/SpoVT family DNA-binding domain-containing protein [Candidatus Methanoperedens sp.]
MAERIIRPVTSDGKITIPKELRDEYGFKDYVEIVKTKEGLLIKAH